MLFFPDFPGGSADAAGGREGDADAAGTELRGGHTVLDRAAERDFILGRYP